MADLHIRDLAPEVLEVLQQSAHKEGISVSEFVRRKLTQESSSTQESCTEADLKNLLTLLPDLADEKIMVEAWQ